MQLPEPLARSPWAQRLDVAIAAVRSAGAALIELRGTITGADMTQSSGVGLLDRASQRALHMDTLPPLPTANQNKNYIIRL